MNTARLNANVIAMLVVLMAAGCERSDVPALVGTLERDRVTIPAELSEPIVRIHVHEGDAVSGGDVILELDDARASAERDRLAALANAWKRRVDELVRGPRKESIREARARLAAAEGQRQAAQHEYARVSALHAESLASEAALDAARAARDARQGEHDAARASLEALLEGTTIEELDQARAQLDAAQAALRAQELLIARLTVTAPRDARIEALPYRQGAQPPRGADVVVLLASGAPHARVYIPVAWRASFTEGAPVSVNVPGFGSYAGRVRWVSSDAAFTPYFALTEHDRDRISHVAEITLLDDAANDLPAGLPVEVFAGNRAP